MVWFALVSDGVGLFSAWFDLVWVFGSVWCLVWFGLAWLGLAWYDLTWFGLVRFGLARFGFGRFGLVWLVTIWFGLISFACCVAPLFRCMCFLGQEGFLSGRGEARLQVFSCQY